MTAAVASVTVAPPTASVIAGQTVALTATTSDATGTVLTGRVITWTSANATVATVSPTGVVTGVAAGGPVAITATSEGKNGTAAITVTPVPVASVTVAPATATVNVGQSVTFQATPKDAGGNALAGRVDYLGVQQSLGSDSERCRRRDGGFRRELDDDHGHQ